jgi:hypothetical protein
MSKTINISDEIYRIIQNDAIPLEDDINSVLHRWATDLGKIDNDQTPLVYGKSNTTNDKNNGRRRPYKRSQPPETAIKITQRKIIPYLLVALRKLGGGAEKVKVEEELYKLLKDTFGHPWYHESISWGTPRWKHYVSWAKQIAVSRELIKKPSDSRRGYWELTKLGKSPSAFKNNDH